MSAKPQSAARDLFAETEAAADARSATENAMADLAEQAVRTALEFGSPQMRAVMATRLKRLMPELSADACTQIAATMDEKIVVTSGLRLLSDIAKRQKTDGSRRSVLAVRTVVERWFLAATRSA